MIRPGFIRRSPVYRRVGKPELAPGFVGEPAATGEGRQKHAGALSLLDLSVLPRWGLKGREAFSWLAAQGALVPTSEQTATRQPDGALMGRLSPGEALLLPSLSDGTCGIGGPVEQIAAAGHEHCYPVPRRDSHAWFLVRGNAAPQMLAKLCAVDLSPDRFANAQIAQTSLARVSSIVIRNDFDGELAYSVLTDTPSAEYLWDCLLEAMVEFNGTIGGIDELGLRFQERISNDC